MTMLRADTKTGSVPGYKVGAPPKEIVDAALAAARQSPCEKSKRGAVIWSPGQTVHLAARWNAPPGELSCNGSALCRAMCRDHCVHAEASAILRALAVTRELFGYFIAHVKVDEVGELVAGGPPSCSRCSALILEVGILGAYLFVGDDEGIGWRFYPSVLFHQLSLEAVNRANQRP